MNKVNDFGISRDSFVKYKFIFSSTPSVLSNDPDKNYSIFYCSAAMRFPHIETDAIKNLSTDNKQVYEI